MTDKLLEDAPPHEGLEAENNRLRKALKEIAGSWGWLGTDKEARRQMLNIAISALEGKP